MTKFYQLIIPIVTFLTLSWAGKRDGANNRDTPSLSYQRSASFNAAYRRAAEAQRNGIPDTNPCYGVGGKARKCDVSEFGNFAIRKQVEATSTCGTPPNRYCNRVASPLGGEMRQCYICDSNHIERMNPASYVVDSNQKSCWVSQIFNESSTLNNATLTISLGKKYLLSYIILPFCNKLPESMVIYKSADNGRRWVPLQYYSSECDEMYNMEENGIILKANEQAAICKNQYSNSNPYTNKRIAFSLAEGRPSAHNLDNSPILQDWVTVTDIKVVFHRLSSPNELVTEREDNYYSLSELILGGRCKCNGHASKCSTDTIGQTRCECQHNTAGADCDRCKDFYFDRPWSQATNKEANECVACNCNLHSDKCIFSSSLYENSGKKSGGVCINCRHNTAGVNCQTCRDGYYRNMAVPMSHRQACRACNCNLHSKKCAFSNSLYMLSGKLSGGICLNCRHNTAGNNCHYCKEGYYRDSSRPITHRRACKECQCHPYGSMGKSCAESGQCVCKEGVAGLKCDRCKPGYSSTKDVSQPCQSDPKESTNTRSSGRLERIPINMSSGDRVAKPDDNTKIKPDDNEKPNRTNKPPDSCGQCRSISTKLDLRKYCSSVFGIQALVQNREKMRDGWVRFAILVRYVYKKGSKTLARRVRRDTKYVYVRESDLHCKCPKIRLNKTYIMIGANDSLEGQDGLLLDKDSIVVQFNADYHKRVKFYKKEERRQSCHAFL